MAKKSRMQEAKNALNAPAASTPAWDAQFQGQVAAPDAKPAPRYKRKTYLLTDELVDRMARLSRTYKVGVNDLARYLIDHAISAAEAGDLDIPIKVEEVEEVPGRVVIKNVIDV